MRNLLFAAALFCISCTSKTGIAPLDISLLSSKYFGTDSSWYMENVPFFECSDQEIEAVYYYRWKLYKAHIRHTGPNAYVTTEFINHVPWDREPFCTINAASMHHIYEGRWLRDPRYMDGYIRYLVQQGGNNRKYSESVADAVLGRFMVHGDTGFLVSQLDSLCRTFEAWYDHYDSSKQLYYIPAMPDATEYTIASIDASGGKDGFEGGDAFRPTINSYMFGNARAIAAIAGFAGKETIRKLYTDRAALLKKLIERDLWNDSLTHFTDRFKVNNEFVKYWDFIRGRELAGMTPWYFNLPDDSKKYSEAWKHLLDTAGLSGPFGLRTNEPSYQYYFKQFVFFEGQPGSQWNGPGWPYQTSIAITAMANLLNNYTAHAVTQTDFVKLLRQYTRQHYLPDGKINLVENYNPDKGGPIVYYYWSNHYNHSTYNNMVITGLCGLRPSINDTLIINPIVDSSISWFRLENVRYHGRNISIMYDRDGTKYRLGKGVTVLIDGKKIPLWTKNGRTGVQVAPGEKKIPTSETVNYALNLSKKGYPVPSASVNTSPDTSLYQAIDGRVWYFPEITNRWTTAGSRNKSDWYAIDFGLPQKFSHVMMRFFGDDSSYAVPDKIEIQYRQNGTWHTVRMENDHTSKLLPNADVTFRFTSVSSDALRFVFAHHTRQVALVEVECY